MPYVAPSYIDHSSDAIWVGGFVAGKDLVAL
jgi:hypothetical protein